MTADDRCVTALSLTRCEVGLPLSLACGKPRPAEPSVTEEGEASWQTRPTSLQRLLVVVVAACVVLALAPFIAATRAGAATNGSITLHVQSARSVNNGAGLRAQGRRRHEVQVADQRGRHGQPGNAGTTRGSTRASPPRRRAAVPIRTTPTRCQWPSVRNTSGYAPIVAQGDADRPRATRKALDDLPARQVPDLGHRRRLQDRRQALHRDARRDDAGDRRDEPDAVTADHIAAPGVQRQRAGRRARTRSTPSPGLAGFSARLTDVLGDGQHGLLRQRAVHGLPARRTRTAPARCCSTPTTGRSSTRHGRRARCVSDSTGLITIPNLGPNRYAATVTPPLRRRRPDLPVGADHDARGKPRPRHLAAGGRDRLRHRADQGRRARAVRPVRLRPDAGDPRARRQSRRPARSRASRSPDCLTSAGKTARSCRKPASPARSPAGPIKNPWIALSDLGRR